MNRLFFFLFISIFVAACSTPASTNDQSSVQENSIQSIESNDTKAISQTTPTQGQEKKLSITEHPSEKAVETLQNEIPATQSKLKVVQAKANEEKPAAAPSRLTAAPTPTSVAPAIKQEVEADEAPEIPTHSNWNQMLQTYVSASGNVNYSSWKENMAGLNDYISELGAYSPAKSWSKSEKMAYWMNLYNAGTIKLILDNYPLKSIMDIDNGKPWNRKWIKAGSNTYSLNQIENDIIRPRFGDGRIHFAINCAAKSCPPISNRAFTANNVNRSLASLTRKFVNNTAFNKISADQLELSNIFNWYAKDFGDIKTFIGKYTDVEISADAKVSFIEYDWALNGK